MSASFCLVEPLTSCPFTYRPGCVPASLSPLASAGRYLSLQVWRLLIYSTIGTFASCSSLSLPFRLPESFFNSTGLQANICRASLAPRQQPLLPTSIARPLPGLSRSRFAHIPHPFDCPVLSLSWTTVSPTLISICGSLLDGQPRFPLYPTRTRTRGHTFARPRFRFRFVP